MLGKFIKITGIKVLAVAFALLASTSCQEERSSVTGWKYNDPTWGGFEVRPYGGQETGPGLVLVQGGTYTKGNVEQDVMYDWNMRPRRVTVSSFYIDETEVANVHYREFVYWSNRTFGADFPQVVKDRLPDTLVWRRKLAYNEPYTKYYFRHPAYNYYPVVGVNWLQANQFCKWRTDRVNEMILIREGILEPNPNQVNQDNFSTEAYLNGQYEGAVKENLPNLDPTGNETRKVKIKDGILLPDYRLPTEAEWEYAALALIGNNRIQGSELISDRRVYPWDGHGLRNPVHGNWQGKFLANFKRGRGDNMGVAGGLNDKADITAPVHAFMPNDYGLYNMAGNVSEWTKDVYRPLTQQDANDFNTHRGNVFKKKKRDEEGYLMPKDSLGRIQYENVEEENNVNRLNYKKAEYRDHKDGSKQSRRYQDEPMYDYGENTLINNTARVYKGGSWTDRAYYLSPGTRRHLQQNLATATIGFRCAMIRLGSPQGNQFKGGNWFK